MLPPEALTIRPAVGSDTEGLLGFYWSLPEHIARVFLPYGVIDHETIRSHLHSVRTGDCLSLVLDDAQGCVMGHAFIQGVRSARPLMGIGLREPVMGLGYGKRMLEQLLEQADRLGLPAVHLSVVKTNTRAENLYKQMGFVRTGVSSFRHKDDSWAMVRRVAKSRLRREEGSPPNGQR